MRTLAFVLPYALLCSSTTYAGIDIDSGNRIGFGDWRDVFCRIVFWGVLVGRPRLHLEMPIMNTFNMHREDEQKRSWGFKALDYSVDHDTFEKRSVFFDFDNTEAANEFETVVLRCR